MKLWMLFLTLCLSVIPYQSMGSPQSGKEQTIDLAAEMGASIGSCIERIGGQDQAAFVPFDRELRSPLSSSDPTLLALLAFYPLHINDADGRTSIDNAATLYRKAARIFPEELRKNVLKPKAGII